MKENDWEIIYELIAEYESTKDRTILTRIEYLLKLNEYHTWELKHHLKIIEYPNKFSRDEKIKEYKQIFDCSNAYSKYHLMLPLLMHLLLNYNNQQAALETSLSLMNESKDYLKAGDFAKTDTGVQRFITNTRFASLELRNMGLLRSDSKHFYKNWQLSLYGILVAGYIYINLQNDIKIDIYKEYTWYKAKESAQLLIINTIQNITSENLQKLFTYLFDEKIVADYLGLYSDTFLEFVKRLIAALNKSNKNNSKEKEELVAFLQSFHKDAEYTKLANAIVLRKDILVNMKTVYDIIDNKR